MRRLSAGLVLGTALAVGWCALAADDPPSQQRDPAARKELKEKWQDVARAGGKHFQAGKLADASAAFEQALALEKLHPDLVANKIEFQIPERRLQRCASGLPAWQLRGQSSHAI